MLDTLIVHMIDQEMNTWPNESDIRTFPDEYPVSLVYWILGLSISEMLSNKGNANLHALDMGIDIICTTIASFTHQGNPSHCAILLETILQIFSEVWSMIIHCTSAKQ